MQAGQLEITVAGKALKAPFADIGGRRIVVNGKRIRIAAVHDEEFVEGEVIKDPDLFLRELRQARLRADLFTFAQPLSDTSPKHDLHFEWDNAAVIPIKDYKEWEGRLAQDTRRNIKKAAKLGVSCRIANYDDRLVQGIVDIYNETPVRQGRRFWHYGKSFEVVKRETGTYLDRSEFIGAYLDNELIGFIKMAYVDRGAHIIYILSKSTHSDKRPTNALIAKAVEVCAGKGLSRFVYCKYVYGKNDTSSLTEFKRRNGFEQLLYPRYYVPLTNWGRVVLQFKLHHGVVNLLPRRLFTALVGMRKRCFELLDRKAWSEAKV